MNRSTNTAPVSLSTSYLIASPCMGISMTTLQSFGTSRPAGTRSRLMARGLYRRARGLAGARGRDVSFALGVACVVLAVGSAAAQAPAGPVPIVSFSSGTPGAVVPAPWAPVKINDRKALTRYDLVADG